VRRAHRSRSKAARPPARSDGTDIHSAQLPPPGPKFYWNNYLTNPATHYHTGSLIDIDFAAPRMVRFVL
jgi:hypothetical protein